MAWFALYTKPRHEKRVFEQLSEKGLEAFLPLTRELRQWKDRRKWVENPLFAGYVFVEMELRERLLALQTAGVVRLVAFGGIPSTIPAWQIEQLKKVLAEVDGLEPADFLRAGDPVEILAGPLAGVQGYLLEKRGETRLAVMLDGIYQSASFVVDRHNIRKLDKHQELV
ncbi:MAG TPA: UpxY family transcription antiterminator [Calditrichia bacterium]|nr:UpxY family transcription antiterminator [Calditrichota bacterium]HQU74019.1 UpxY family transcription antiterminator [Calditrichia bacterium]HQV30508.1 UpxY family transcription antiterminator [Calditrichia bacterium]